MKQRTHSYYSGEEYSHWWAHPWTLWCSKCSCLKPTPHRYLDDTVHETEIRPPNIGERLKSRLVHLRKKNVTAIQCESNRTAGMDLYHCGMEESTIGMITGSEWKQGKSNQHLHQSSEWRRISCFSDATNFFGSLWTPYCETYPSLHFTSLTDNTTSTFPSSIKR